jgi:hypothetical protein
MRGISVRNLLLASVLSLAFAPVADAASINLEAFAPSQGKFGLFGSEETPPNSSPAVGVATFVLDTQARTLTSVVNFTGLLSGATAAHIHLGDPGVAGPVIHPYTLPTNVLGQRSGGFLDIWSSSTPTNPLTDAIIAQILGGHTYINIHSSTLPDGEIRGQIVMATNVIPEPSGLVLGSVGALVLLGYASLCRRGMARA